MRGSREKYEAILSKVPDVEPEAYDQVPTVFDRYKTLVEAKINYLTNNQSTP